MKRYGPGYGRVRAPSGAAVLNGMLPHLRVGKLAANQLAMGFVASAEREVELGSLVFASHGKEKTIYAIPGEVIVPLQSGGVAVSSNKLNDATIHFDGTGASLHGALSTSAVVQTLVESGRV